MKWKNKNVLPLLLESCFFRVIQQWRHDPHMARLVYPPPPLLLIIITQSLNSVYVCLRNNAEITFSGSQPVYHDLSTRHHSPPPPPPTPYLKVWIRHCINWVHVNYGFLAAYSRFSRQFELPNESFTEPDGWSFTDDTWIEPSKEITWVEF